MGNTLTLGKRAFAAFIAAVTILSTVGLAALAPMTANAAMDADPGDTIKGSTLSTVYYYGYDGSRYTFPNVNTYETWFDGFNDVVTIDDGDLADISLAGNVVYRPGSRWIKIDTDPKTYAVSRDGMIHWIETETVAVDFDGSDWNTNIDDVPDVFFVDYTSGASLMTATAFDGMMYMDGSDYMLAWDGETRMVTAAGRTGNYMEEDFFLDGTGIDDSALSSGSDVTGYECDLVDAAQTGCVETTGGDLTVSLASMSPASLTVPNSASGVEVAVYKLTADSAVTLETLAVSMVGLSDTTAVANNGVYLYEDGARLTDGKTVNSSTRKATFAGLDLDFSNGQTRYLAVLVDMDDSTTDGTFGFEVKNDDDVMTNGDADGSYPVAAATHSIVDLAVGTVTIDKTGSLSDPVLGEMDAEIAEFNIEAGSEEPIELHRLTLEIEDAKDHSDFQLYQGNTWVKDGEYIGNDLVLFDLSGSPYFLDEGTDRDFNVTADIGGDTGDDIKVHLDNDADILAIGDDFGFGVTVDRSGYDEGSANCTSSGDDCSFSTIEGGDVTIAFNGPPADDVKNDADEVSFFEFSITSERFSEFNEFEIDVVGTDLEDGSDAALEDIRIENCDTGALVSGPVELDVSGGNSQTLMFTDSFVMDAGETLNLCASADINDTVAVQGDTFEFTLIMSSFDVEDEDGDAITDIIPSSDLVGNVQTVEDASLDISLASSPSGETTYVKGQSDVTTVGYNMTAGTGSDIEITDLAVATYVDEDGAGGFSLGTDGAVVAEDRISSCSLYDGADDMLISGPESPESGGDIIFDGFSWWILAGETGSVEVVCNLANVDAGTADLFAFELDASTDVEALDDEGQNVTPSGTANTGETVTIAIEDAGDLDLAAGGDIPDAEFLITGSDGNLVSSFRFDAQSEAFRIDRITVSEEQGEVDTTVTDSDVYANNVEKVRISYEKEDTTTGTAEGTLTGNERTFNLTSGNEVYVPKDDHTELNVEVDVAVSDRSSGSATSNERVRMGLSVDTTADDEFRARGVASNETLNDDSSDSTATAYSTVFPLVSEDMEIHVVRETAPTVTVSASTPSGSGFSAIDQEVLRFNVAANANEDVVLRSILFSAATSDNDGSGWNVCDTGMIEAGDFDFYETSDLGSELDDDAEWTLLADDGTVCTTGADIATYAQLTFSDDSEQETILAGTTTTYSLYFDANGASSAEDDTVQFLVEGDTFIGTFIDDGESFTAPTADPSDTSVTVSGAGTILLGDVLCNDDSTDGICDDIEEQMLVVAGAGTTSLTVVRGYNGSNLTTDSGDVLRLPGALLWQDDGSKTVIDPAQEYYGAHLVNDLPLNASNGLEF